MPPGPEAAKDVRPPATALVVDDVGSNRRLLAAYLGDRGIFVREAADGLEALDIVRQGGVDIVVSDLLMPRMDGYRLTYEIRRAGHNVPIVLVTASFMAPGDHALGLVMGADVVIEKPVSDGALSTAIDAAVAKARAAGPRPPVPPEAFMHYAERLEEKLTSRILRSEEQSQLMAARNRELADIAHGLIVEKDRARSILEVAADGIYGVDAEGRFTFVNRAAAEMLGRPARDLVGRPAHDAVHAVDGLPCHDRGCDLHTPAPDGSARRSTDKTFRRADGTPFPVEFAVCPNASGVVVTFRDVTEPRATRTRMNDLNADLTAFANVAAHDLQEPLRTVAGAVKRLSRRHAPELTGDAAEYFTFVERGVEQMQAIVRRLLEYATLGTTDVTCTDVALDAALDKALADVEPALTASGAVVTRDPLPVVTGDAEALRKVFANLLSNSVRFAGERPPRIHVDAEATRLGWRVRVQDQGSGIPSGSHAHVFEPFRKFHPGKSGTGLGLAIVKRLVEAQGGSVAFTSEADRGALFTFDLRAPGSRPTPADAAQLPVRGA